MKKINNAASLAPTIIPVGALTSEIKLSANKVQLVTNKATKVINEMRSEEDPYKNVIIAGGGKIGSRLAKAIEKNHGVKVIEENEERAKII